LQLPAKWQNTDSKSADRKVMGVRFPLPAPNKGNKINGLPWVQGFGRAFVPKVYPSPPGCSHFSQWLDGQCQLFVALWRLTIYDSFATGSDNVKLSLVRSYV